MYQGNAISGQFQGLGLGLPPHVPVPLTSRLEALVGRLAGTAGDLRSVGDRLAGMEPNSLQASGQAMGGPAGVPSAEESVCHLYKLCDAIEEQVNRVRNYVG